MERGEGKWKERLFRKENDVGSEKKNREYKREKA